MADQGKWFKLWESALDDPDLENLELDNWARWARLGTFLKKHGRDGTMEIIPPARSLQTLFRVATYDAVLRVLKLLPSYALEEMESVTANVTIASVTYKLICTNWNKYQGDFSGDRVRKYRHRVTANVTLQEEKRSRREEKRGDETSTPIAPKGAESSKILEWFETTWKAYPKERRSGKKAALRSYQKAVKDVETARDVAAALDVYLASKTVQDGFVKNASTWFANWEDYKDDQRRNSQSIHREDIERCADPRTAGAGVQAAAANSLLHQLANSKAFPK